MNSDNNQNQLELSEFDDRKYHEKLNGYIEAMEHQNTALKKVLNSISDSIKKEEQVETKHTRK